MMNLAFACCVLIGTQHPAASNASVLPTDPRLEATLIDGTTVNGRVAGLLLGPQGTGNLTLVDDEKTTVVNWSRLVKLVRLGSPSPRPSSAESLHFISGDMLRGAIRTADSETLEFAPTLAPTAALSVPVTRLRGVIFNRPEQDADQNALDAALLDPEREGDAVWLTNGDRRVWSLAGLDRDRLRFAADAGPAELERSSVAAIGFDPALADPPSEVTTYLEAILGDGSKLGLAGATLENGSLQVQTRAGLSLRLPLEALREAYVLGGSVTYLSERDPAAREFIPYLDRHPGRVGIDTTWDGAALSVRDRSYSHGLGMLPRTLLVYRIEPGDRRFQALLGVDDRAGDQASVVFRILLDRREVFVSPTMTRQAAPVPIDIDLQGARLLVLITEFGERGDVQDHADWIEARIIRDLSTGPPAYP